MLLALLCVQQTLRFFWRAQSGLMKGDYSVVDFSMQCGSFDVGVSLPAPVLAAFPFPSCGLALSAELRLYLVFCFQSWNVDCVICYLSPEMASCWTYVFPGPWILSAVSRMFVWFA